MNVPHDEPARDDEPLALGGDPACWLGWVCAECGRFSERAQPEWCEHCGARLGEE